MFVSAVLLTLLWLAAPVARAHTPPAKAHKAAPKVLDSAAFQQHLAATLHGAAFAGDQIRCTVTGHEITLQGVVHQAEHKGVALHEARVLAYRSHWSDYQVHNELAVQLIHDGFGPPGI